MGSQTCFEQNGNKQMRVVVTFSFLKNKDRLVPLFIQSKGLLGLPALQAERVP
jgi:hypothetical protein